MALADMIVLLGLNLAVAVGTMTILWALLPRQEDIGFVDPAWPMVMLGVAALTLARTDGDATRQWLLIWLVAVWGLRLCWYLLMRRRRQGGAGRYAEVVAVEATAKGWSQRTTALVLIFVPQGILSWLISLPVQLGQVAPSPAVGWLGWIGAMVVVIGIGLESIADAQMSAFRREPNNRQQVLMSGLWRYSRHPNYFGDACVWWGLWLIAAETGWLGIASIIGPVSLTYILSVWADDGTEARERSRPGYLAYARRTSALLPLPPKTT